MARSRHFSAIARSFRQGNQPALRPDDRRRDVRIVRVDPPSRPRRQLVSVLNSDLRTSPPNNGTSLPKTCCVLVLDRGPYYTGILYGVVKRYGGLLVPYPFTEVDDASLAVKRQRWTRSKRVGRCGRPPAPLPPSPRPADQPQPHLPGSLPGVTSGATQHPRSSRGT